ncbi:hypothetical protein NQ318_005043, partial [Aromia moschata]
VLSVKEAVPSMLATPLATILIGICVLLIAYEYWFRNLRYVKLSTKIPGPPTIPIVGNAYLALGKSPGANNLN